ncbi:MAG: hypothetical protein ACXWPM_00550 [Bdellovibrionota bacterium]
MSLATRVKISLRQWVDRHLTAKTYLGECLRKIRRAYLGNFRPEYVQKSIAENRKGDCHRCGACCELVYKCPFLGRDGQNLPYCRIYGDLRPASCYNYPFDAIDSEVAQCGYSFKKS